MKTALSIVTIIVLTYIGVSAIAWKARNPLGNDWTYWLYLSSALRFERVAELQIRPLQ